MAFKVAETKEAVCYLWSTIVFLAFAVVFFAIGSTRTTFVYIGITSTLLAFIFFLYFVAKRRGETRSCPKVVCGRTCVCVSDSACDRCMMAILCLQQPDPERGINEARNRLNQVSGTGDYWQVSEQSSTVTLSRPSCRAANWRQLRSLDKSISKLLREYAYMERYPHLVTEMEPYHLSLLQLQHTLGEWMAGHDTPSDDDVRTMKRTLIRMKSELRQARTATEGNE